MATGIEQLGALAGPVNQGDVVMRQSEAPAGAAAMLNKMARKNTPRVYKLPDTKPATPEFMQSAMANVQRDLTSMARNVESVGPEGHMLAYITPEEAGILKLLGGSGDVNPATGVPQFDKEIDRGSYLSRTAGGTQKEKSSSAPSSNPYKEYAESRKEAGGKQAENQAVIKFYEDREKKGESGMPQQIADVISQDSNIGNYDINPKTETAQSLGIGMMKSLQTGEREPEQYGFYDQMVKEIEAYEPFKMKLGSLPSMLGQMAAPFGLDKDDPKRLFRTDEEGELTDDRTLEGLQKRLKELGGREGMEMLKRYDPKLYYKFNVPATTQGIEDLSKVDLGKLGNSKEDRRLAARVMEAREYMSKKQEGRPEEMGAAPAPFVEPETPAEQDPRAGAFAIGDMMPYTSDRTGGVEMEVPLGRRFQLGREGEMAPKGMDLQEAMKYATMGGYSQLEPFQEYIARRRKYLGEEEPEYFDEEGNVIFSGVN